MSFLEKTLHLLVPRPSNNHRAKVLHLSSLSFYIVALLVFQIGLTTIGKYYPSVLSYASNITIIDLLNETNNRRQQNSVGTVQLNDQLSDAARRKSANMFTEQYWAHVSPSGKDPWSFISAAGYNFLFAGENLARDFGDSKAVVDAWMNSPTHRDNLLNSRYKDVGFAITNGKYGEHETTLVVQMFGTKPNAPATVDAPQNQVQGQKAEPATNAPLVRESPPDSKNSGFKIDPLQLTRNISLVLIGFLLIVMIIDGVVAYKNKPIRSTGHNFAHMLFLLALLMAMVILGRTGLTL